MKLQDFTRRLLMLLPVCGVVSLPLSAVALLPGTTDVSASMLAASEPNETETAAAEDAANHVKTLPGFVAETVLKYRANLDPGSA